MIRTESHVDKAIVVEDSGVTYAVCELPLCNVSECGWCSKLPDLVHETRLVREDESSNNDFIEKGIGEAPASTWFSTPDVSPGRDRCGNHDPCREP